MSSYLNLYLRTKTKEDAPSKDLLFMSFSRNTEVYQYFDEEISNLYSSSGEVTKITEEAVSNIMKTLETAIKRQQEFYKIYKECKEVQSAIESSEYIEELQDTLHKFEFISSILFDCSLDYTDFEGLYAFID